ncbi:hypothetical protein [Accumulibacter sp.]|uniref:hypothetical protein n=1 Tax=Accumulibacter sp. TaxID=2053492 RepID=UPI002BFF9A25|nr:hypothetical protein [Accumulibacter sp.]HRF06975.1 hypothetical protein [Accumulibacter sp.]
MGRTPCRRRRNDAGSHVGRQCDRLVHCFDAESLFYDQGSIDSGDHFPGGLAERLAGVDTGARAALSGQDPQYLGDELRHPQPERPTDPE